MYVPFTLREDPTGSFTESDNYQPLLVLNNIASNINDFSVSFEESNEYELKVETVTLAPGQNFIEMFGLMLASLYIFNVQYPKKLEGSLFLQKFLLRVGDETKIQHMVLKLISKVKKAVI